MNCPYTEIVKCGTIILASYYPHGVHFEGGPQFASCVHRNHFTNFGTVQGFLVQYCTVQSQSNSVKEDT